MITFTTNNDLIVYVDKTIAYRMSSLKINGLDELYIYTTMYKSQSPLFI